MRRDARRPCRCAGTGTGIRHPEAAARTVDGGVTATGGTPLGRGGDGAEGAATSGGPGARRYGGTSSSGFRKRTHLPAGDLKAAHLRVRRLPVIHKRQRQPRTANSSHPLDADCVRHEQ